MFNVDRLKTTAALQLGEVYGILAIEVILAVLIGLGLTATGLDGAAWILGGIAAGAIAFSSCRIFGVDSLQPNRNARKAGQLLVGLTIGLSLQHNNLNILPSQFLIFLGLPLFLMLSGAAIGWVYSRLEKIDLLSGLLATTPGNIGVMASIAADYSKNTALVSLVQLTRFTTVIFVIPIIANAAVPRSTHNAVAAVIQKVVAVSWFDLCIACLLLAITLVVVYLGNKLKIPMAAFLCAIAVGLLFDAFLLVSPISIDFQLPALFNLIGQILLGVTIGEYWGLNPKLSFATIIRSLLPVVLMVITAFLAALLIQCLTGWNWLTCVLVTAPGGSPEMIWIALTLHQDTDVVTAAHVIRLLTINLSLPLLLALVPAIATEARQPE
ncbi:AbrB family transcriptional regulator [Cyanobacteria bacterium FACHB-471]|nr:AbrB family transcriptional regulator [Cyanobacteria bacterium FACHB-471]